LGAITLAVRDNLFLTEISTPASFVPNPGATYLYGKSDEERSEHLNVFRSAASTVKFLNIVEQRPYSCVVEIEGAKHDLALRSSSQLQSFWQWSGANDIYIDITGLEHGVWAPLLKSALSTSRKVRIVYVEPLEYRKSPSPTAGEIFDLSARVRGLSPIAGFARTGPRTKDETTIFVPLLGFEGPRFKYVYEQLEPKQENILPIVGVPGFRPEYPFYTYLGNRVPLEETKAWRRIRFATAHCPFSALEVLEAIARNHAQDHIQVAPIGTKPHAVAAVLFCLKRPSQVELVYDHPIRKPKRTAGADHLLVYDVPSI
jgi:hypothetical protein